MNYYKLLFLLPFFSFFIAKSSEVDYDIPPVYTKTKIGAVSPITDIEVLKQFNPITCKGTFYENDQIIILEKTNNKHLIIICEEQMIGSVVNTVKEKNANHIDCIIARYSVSTVIADIFAFHVINDPAKPDKFVSLSGKANSGPDFCFFVTNFQTIKCTQLQKNINKVKKISIGVLEISITFCCLYLLISFLTNIKHSIYS